MVRLIQMQHQKMQIHGAASRGSGGSHYTKNGTTSLGASTNSKSLGQFSVDAMLGGSANSANKGKSHLLNVTSDEENSFNSWDDAEDEEDDDIRDIDVGPDSPTALSTTSESSRGGSSPSINRSANKLNK